MAQARLICFSGGGMDETVTDERLASALVSLTHHVLHLLTEVGRTHRLSQQQVRLLCAIKASGGVGMSELGRQTQLEKSNLSNLDRKSTRLNSSHEWIS